MKGIELRYDGNGNVLEPAVRNGMMAVGDTLRQNQALLLTLHKGELKERPSAGVGLSDILAHGDKGAAGDGRSDCGEGEDHGEGCGDRGELLT